MHASLNFSCNNKQVAMDLCDIRTLVPGTIVKTDICIVGSGPVGLSLASDLSGKGFSITVIESGGRTSNDWADQLNIIESVGAERVMNQTLVRNRGFGGTSQTWSGRIAAFDDTDFRVRSWIDHSGWPIPRDELSRYLPRTLVKLGSPVADNTAQEFLKEILAENFGNLTPANSLITFGLIAGIKFDRVTLCGLGTT